MFKNLKDKLATQVTKTNQTLLSNILSTDSTSSSSRDDNPRSRLDSSASDISQSAQNISSSRQYFPPSDIESDEENDSHKTKTYKNKYIQLKKAYDEVEHERDRIKDLLQKYQDASLKRKAELREQIKAEQQAKQQVELTYRTEIQSQSEQMKKDQDKINKLETALTRSKESIQSQQAELIIQNSAFQQQLLDKQTTIRELQQHLSIEREEHRKLVDALKTDYENLTNELRQTKDDLQSLPTNPDETHLQLRQEDEQTIAILKEELENLRQSFNDRYENELKEKSARITQLEQTQSDLRDELNQKHSDIETLKSEILALVNLNEENTRRIDEYENAKYNAEQEILEKDRQLSENEEKLQEMQSTLEQAKENNEKLRKALQKLKENSEQEEVSFGEAQMNKLKDDYEQHLKDKDQEYQTKLKAMAREMSTRIDENERNYQQQLRDFIQNSRKSETELANQSEQRVITAEQRTVVAEAHLSKLSEEIKEKQLDHYRVVQELQNQIQTLLKEKVSTLEKFSQTSAEDIQIDETHLVEPVEIDYLKEIILAYMTGTDRLTMVKVICAVLRYTEQQTSAIIEQEKLCQSRWLNSTR